MRFAGFQKTSLIDYPDRISSVLFSIGCNLRCPYCHNGSLVEGYNGPFYEEEMVLETLRERQQYVNSVVVSGGEPTIDPGLLGFISRLKESNFEVKLDTNGLKPDVLAAALNIVDFVALDVKTTIDNYHNLGAKKNVDLLRSINLIMESGIDYEFRCTMVPGFVDKDKIIRIGEMVNGAEVFTLQQFLPGNTLDPLFGTVEPFDPNQIQVMSEAIKPYVKRVDLRI